MLFVIALVVLAIIAAVIAVVTKPIADRQLAVRAANRQYMIDNNTSHTPFN